jgi:hypothetical protein
LTVSAAENINRHPHPEGVSGSNTPRDIEETYRIPLRSSQYILEHFFILSLIKIFISHGRKTWPSKHHDQKIVEIAKDICFLDVL